MPQGTIAGVSVSPLQAYVGQSPVGDWQPVTWHFHGPLGDGHSRAGEGKWRAGPWTGEQEARLKSGSQVPTGSESPVAGESPANHLVPATPATLP